MLFKDKDKLSPRYIPQNLPHREEQIKWLKELTFDSLRNPKEARLRVMLALGGVGTGKTVTALRFGEIFKEDAKRRGVALDLAYLNPKVHGGSRLILYRYLAKQVAKKIFSLSLSAEELLLETLNLLSEENRYLFIIFDELDYFLRHSKESLIYDFTRLNEISPLGNVNVLGILFITRSLEFKKRLDKAEVSTLGSFTIKFPSYNSSQIFDILSERRDEAFKRGVVGDDVLDAISDISAKPPVNGDVRYALDLLLYAGTYAEIQGSEKVMLDHLRKVVGSLHYSITTEDIMSLSNGGKLSLLALARALKVNKSLYVGLSDIRKMSSLVYEEYGVKPKEELEDSLQDLADRNLIEIKSLRAIGIVGMHIDGLESLLDGLIRRIEESK